MKWILIISLLGNLCYADDVIFLEKNKPAPSDGYLFTPEATKQTRIKLIERDTFETLNESLTKTNKLYETNADLKDKQIQILMDRNDQLATSLKDSQTTSTIEKVVYFLLGAATIYGGARVVKEVSK